MFQVYMLTNRVNNKKYIGITNTTLKKRINRHVAQSTLTQPRYLIHKAIKKYGLSQFDITVLHDNINTVNEAKLLEQQYIEKYCTFVVDFPDSGYNMTRGGDGIFGYHHTAATKERIALQHRGKTRSEQTRQRISESKRGKTRPPHVQQILKQCRDTFHGSGADNPNAKRWIVTNVITGTSEVVVDLRGFCTDRELNYNSLYYTLKNKKPYRKTWLLESLI